MTRLVLPGIGWAPALAFAAAVAPTDAVAATSVLTRLGAPQRVVTILEGESLINDAVALTAFGLAVEAMAHPFTFGHGVARLVEVVLGGIAYGLVVSVVIGRIRIAVSRRGGGKTKSFSRCILASELCEPRRARKKTRSPD